jgi:RNA polymerase sigma-70 factor, ECF subfamily
VASNVDFSTAIMELQTVSAWTEDSGDRVLADAALVEAAREGDRGAFGQLYDRYARMVHGVMLARVPFNAVDDLVQDVFLAALGRLRSLRDAASFGAWIAAIARNRAHDYHRRTRETVELTDEALAPEASDPAAARATSVSQATASQHLAPDDEAAAALQAIRSLPEAYRETLILRLVEGMTGPEIAARTGLTPGSVRVNLHRGMQQLREKLGGRG